MFKNLPSRGLRTLFLCLIIFIFGSANVLAQEEAADLTGTGNSIEIQYDLNLAGFTLETWIYMTEMPSGVSFGVFSKTVSNFPEPLDVYINPSGNVNVLTGNGTATFQSVLSSATLQANRWHHIAVTYDPALTSSEVQLYIDGNPDVSLDAGTVANTDATTDPLMIGNRGDGATNAVAFFDEFRAWSVVRTAGEISTDMLADLTGLETGLDVYYNFDNGTGASDLAGSDHHGMEAGSVYYVHGMNLSTPPVLSNLQISNITGNSVDVDQLDIDNYAETVNYIITQSGTTPTAAQINAGLDGDSNPAVFNGGYASIFPYSGFGTTFDNLSPTTNYFLFYVANDQNGVASNIISENFTTDISDSGNALSFDGGVDFVDIGNPADLQITTGTIEAWIKVAPGASDGDYHAIATYTGAYGLYLFNGELVSYGTSAVNSGATGLDDDAWHHVALTFTNGGTWTFYVDGNPFAASPGTNSFLDGTFSGTEGFRIGLNGATSQFFEGAMDNIRVWNSILSEENIRYSASHLDVTNANLVASYTFQEGVGTTLGDMDASYGPYDGTFAGSPTWTSSTIFDNDVIAPALFNSTPRQENISESQFDLIVNATEKGTAYFVALTSGSPTPTVAEVVSGAASSPLANQVTGAPLGVYDANLDMIFNVGGLSVSTTYDVYVVMEDESFNQSTAVYPLIVTTTSNTAPTLTLAAGSQGYDYFDVDVDVDELSDIYVVVLTDNYNPPNADDVKAGTDGLGNPGFDSNSYGSISGTSNFGFSGLTAGTTYYTYWVAEDQATNNSSVELYSITTDPPPVDITYSTIDVPGTSLSPGSTDNLIYTVEAVVSGGTATMIGMFFTPQGTYSESDFDQFNFYANIGSNDFASASLIGSNGFFSGDANIPDGSIGIYFSDVYTNQTVYWYVTADVSASAGDGNTIELTQPGPENNFGIDEDRTSNDGGLTPSNTFTIDNACVTGDFVGTVDDDVTNAANWCNGIIPGTSDDVTYEANATISENGIALSGGSITIQGGSVLSYNLGGFDLDLTSGTFTNNGIVSFSNTGNIINAPNFINNGILRGEFSCTGLFTNGASGTVSPGFSPGCMTFPAGYNDGGGTLDIEIDGTTVCTEHDQIDATGGTATLSGTLNVSIGYAPTDGDVVTIITADAISGSFATTNIPDNWILGYTATDVTLTYEANGSALAFDGANTSVAVGSLGAFPTEGAIEFWINPSGFVAGHGVFDTDLTNTGSGLRVEMAGTNGMWLAIDDGGVVTHTLFAGGGTDDIALATWHHIALIWDTGASEISGYVNGEEKFSATQSNWPANIDDLVIGAAYEYNVNRYWDGLIDEFRIWNTKVGIDELRPIAAAPLVDDSGLLAYYKFDESGNTSVAIDSKGANDGTLLGFAADPTNSWTPSASFDDPQSVIKIYGLDDLNPIVHNNTASISEGTDFSHVIHTDAAVTKVFSIENHGIGELNTISISAGAAPLTSNSAATQTELVPGESTGFSVTYDPTGTGLDAQAFTISSNSSVDPSFTLNIQGTGVVNNALDFDGTGNPTEDRITASDDNSLDLTTMTVEGWFYFDDVSGTKYLVSKSNFSGAMDGDYSLSIAPNTGAKARFSIHDNVGWTHVFGTTTLVTGQWYHIAGTFDGTDLRIYIDGVIDDAGAVSIGGSFSNSSSNPLELGWLGAGTSAGQYFDGQMDEVRIWEPALDATLISSRMNNYSISVADGLVASYDFNIGTPSGVNTGIGEPSLIDISANTNDGTLTNFLKTGAGSNYITSTVGAAATPEITVESPAGTGLTDNQAVIPGDSHYGYVGQAGYAQSFTIRNDGLADLTITSIVAAGTDWSLLDASETLPAIIPAGGDMTFEALISQSSLTTGNRPGTFTINNNDADEGAFIVNVEADVVENALDFDGTGDHVAIPYDNTGVTAYTLEAWVNVTDLASDRTIFYLTEDGNEAGAFTQILAINTAGVFEHYVWDGAAKTVTGNTVITPGQWYHVAITGENSQNIRLFVNGVEDAAGVAVGTLQATDNEINLGLGVATWPNNFNGKLDEMRLWDYARNESEIAADAGISIREASGLIASYDFNNAGTTNQLRDITGNGNDGTLDAAFDLDGTDWLASTALNAALSELSVYVDGAVVIADGDAADVTKGTNFGNVSETRTVRQTFHMENIGINSLTVSGITGNAVFDIDNQPTLPASLGNESFDIIYTPNSGADGTTISIANDAEVGTPPFTFDVSGALVQDLALDFDGVDDIVQIPIIDPGAFLTIEAWIRPDDLSPGGNPSEIVRQESNGIGPDYYLGFDGTDNFRMFVKATSDGFHTVSTGGLNLTDGNWHHVAGVYDGANIYLYVDGTLASSLATGSGSIRTNSAGENIIGAFGVGSYFEFFDGQMDEIRIWNEARDQASIQSTMYTALAGTESGLVAYYSFDNTFVTPHADNNAVGGNELVVADKTGTYNGTASGFAMDTDQSNWVYSSIMQPQITRLEAVSATSIEIEFGENIAFTNNSTAFVTALSQTGIDLTGATAAIGPANLVTISLSGTPLGGDVSAATLSIGDNELESAATGFSVKGHVAQALEDGVAPSLTSMEIYDTDDDGYVDRIDLVFDENIDTDDGAAPVIGDLGTLTLPDGSPLLNLDGVFGVGTPGAGTMLISDPAGASNVVSITQIPVFDHQTEVENTAIGSTDISTATNTLWVDAYGNALPIISAASVTKTDNAVPSLLYGTTVSTTEIDLTFSEAVSFVTDETTSLGQLSATGFDPLSTNGDGVATIRVNLNTSILPNYSQTDLQVTAGAFEDLSPALNQNNLNNTRAINDGIAPGMTSMEIYDTNDDGFVDRIDLVFDENIDTDDGAAPVIADLGTFTLPDGSPLLNLDGVFGVGTPGAGTMLISDPAGASNVVSITQIPVFDHQTEVENTAVGSTDIAIASATVWVDAAENPLPVITAASVPKVDNAVPSLVSGIAVSNSEIDLIFSEAVNFVTDETTSLGQLSATGFDPFDTNGDGVATIRVNLNTSVLSNYSQSDLQVTAGAFEDLSPALNQNNLNGGRVIDDAIAPSISDMAIYDTDNDGFIDQIILTFDEFIDTDDGISPVIGDLGTLTLPDGSTLQNLDDEIGVGTPGAGTMVISDPAGASNQVTISSIPVFDYASGIPNTAVNSTDIAIASATVWIDAVGNALPIIPSASVTKTDMAAPVLASSTPADGAISASPTDEFVFTFSENVTIGTGLIDLHQINPAIGSIQTFDITNAGETTVSGTTVTTIGLLPMTLTNEYAIRIATTALVDDEGIPYAGITNDTDLNFIVNNIKPVNCSTDFSGFSGDSNNGNLSESVCNTEPASVSSLVTSEETAVSLFYFNVFNGDNNHENMTSITITNGNPAIDWTQVIAGAQLIDENGDVPRNNSNVEITPVITATSLAWTGIDADNDGNDWGDLDGNSTSPNGTEFALRVWFNTDLGTEAVDIDGENLVFELITNDFAGVDRVQTAANTFSNQGTTPISSGNITFDVVATEYQFLAQPTNTERTQTMTTVTMEATDIYGTRDEDYVANDTGFELTTTGSALVGPVGFTGAFSLGVATLDPVVFDFVELTPITLGGTGGSLPVNEASNTFTIDDTVTPNVDLAYGARYYDGNGDGVIDEVVMKLDEPVDYTSGVNTDFSYTGSGTLTSAISASSANNPLDVDDQDEYITFGITGFLNGTDASGLDLNYTGTGLSDFGSTPNTAASVDPDDYDEAFPIAISLTPVDGETNATALDYLEIEFSEDVTALGGNLILRDGGTLSIIEAISVTNTSKTLVDGSTVTFSLDNLMAKGVSYFVTVAASTFEDVSAGNDFAGLLGVDSWNFVVQDAAPRISAVSPLDDAVNISRNADITLTFDEPVNFVGTVTVSTADGGGGLTAGAPFSFTVADATGNGTNEITIAVPTLTSQELVTVTIPPTAFTAVDNGASLYVDNSPNNTPCPCTDYEFNYGVILALDNIDPLVLTTQLDEDFTNMPGGVATLSSGVWSGAGVQATVDPSAEALGGTGDAALILAADGNNLISPSVTSANYLTFSYRAETDLSNGGEAEVYTNGGSTLIGSFSSTSTGWQQFYHKFAAPYTGTIEIRYDDVSGADEGLIIDGFKVDEGFSPYDDQIEVPLSTTELKIRFDEDVQAGTGLVKVFANTNPDVEIFSKNVGSGFVDFTDNEMTIDISSLAPLPGNVEFYVTMPVTAVEDVSGNQYAGVLNEGDWSFTTRTETNPPEVSARIPEDNETDVDTETAIGLLFNEPILAGSSGTVALFLSASGEIVEQWDVTNPAHLTASDDNLSIKGDTLRIYPSAPLSGLTGYNIRITAGAFVDYSGNAFAGLLTANQWNFTTGTNDTVAPDIDGAVADSFVPAHDPASKVVSLTPSISFTMTEPVNGVGGNYIRIYDKTNAQVHVDIDVNDASIDYLGNTVEINNVVLDYNTNYYILIPTGALEDNTGNPTTGPIGGDGVWEFTTILDQQEPSVVSLNVGIDGTTDARDARTFVMEFDEPVQWGTGTIDLYYTLADGAPITSLDVTSDVNPVNEVPEDFDLGLPVADGTSSISLSAGDWTRLDAKSSGAALAQGAVGDAVMLENVGDHITTPDLTNVTGIQFDYRTLTGGGNTATFRVWASSDGGSSFDINLGQNTAALTDFSESFTYNGAPNTYTGPIRIEYLGAGNEALILDNFVFTSANYLSFDFDLPSGGTDYYITVSRVDANNGAITDVTTDTDNSFEGFAKTPTPDRWKFSTNDDGAAPTLVDFSPTNGADINVTTEDQIVLTFNEIVTPQAGKFINIYYTDPLVAFQIEVDEASAVVAAGQATFTYDISDLAGQELSGGVPYYFELEADAFLDEDASPNGNVAFGDGATWAITTNSDVVAPAFTFTPLDGTTGQNVNVNLVFSFDERVDAIEDDSIKIFYNDGVMAHGFDALTDGVYDESTAPGSTLTYSTTLSGNTAYYVNVDGGAFEDKAANPSAAISNNTDWNFVTAVDAIKPVIAFSPTGASQDPAATSLVVTLNERSDARPGKFIRVMYDSDDSEALAIPVNSEVADNTLSSGSVYTYDVSNLLSGGVSYYVTIDVDAYGDATGNTTLALIEADGWAFSMADDGVAPNYTGVFSPVDGSSILTLSDPFVINFDEPVNTASANINFYYLVDNALAFTINANTSTPSNGGTRHTYTNSGLQGNTSYYVQIDAGAFVDNDAAMNPTLAIADNSTWNFNTIGGDGQAPTAMLSPVNTATDVDIRGNLVLTFSEPVYTTSGNITISGGANGPVVIPVTDASQVSGSGSSTITINPNNDLFVATAYTITMDPGAITDGSSNNYAHGTWGFTTIDGVDVDNTTGANHLVNVVPTLQSCIDGFVTDLSGGNESIYISESNPTDFGDANGTGYTIELTLSSGYTFDTGVGSYALSTENDITITNLTVAANTVTITYDNDGSGDQLDEIVISGLAINNSTPAITSATLTRSGGDADLYGNSVSHQINHLDVSTRVALGAPSLDFAGGAIVSGVMQIDPSESFSVTASGSGGTFDWYYYDGAAAYQGATATEGDLNGGGVYPNNFDHSAESIYSFTITETEADGCISAAADLAIAVVDISQTPVGDSFLDSDPNIVITASNPDDHVASFSGQGLVNLSIPATPTDASVEFNPGIGSGSYAFNYTLTSSLTGISYSFDKTFTVTQFEVAKIFEGTYDHDFCVDDDPIVVNAETSTIEGFDRDRYAFFNFELVDEFDVDVLPMYPLALIAPFGHDIIDDGYGDVSPADGVDDDVAELITDGWTFDPSQLPAGTYTIKRIVMDTTINDFDLANTLTLFTNTFHINDLPSVEIQDLDDTYFCEDSGLIDVDVLVDGSPVVVAGYSLQRLNAADSTVANTTPTGGDTFNPMSPEGAGTNPALYRLIYTSEESDFDIDTDGILSPKGCINIDSAFMQVLTKPEAPYLVNDFTGIGRLDEFDNYKLEFNEGDTIPDLEAQFIANPGDTLVQWYNVLPSTLFTSEGVNGSVLDSLTLFTTSTPNGYISKTFFVSRKHEVNINGSGFAGCESDVRDINIQVYNQASAPLVNTGVLVDGTAANLGSNRYAFEYCEGDAIDNIVLTNDISDDRSYFILLDETKTPITTTELNSIPPAMFSFDSPTLDTETTVYLIHVQNDSTYIEATAEFAGTYSDTTEVYFRINSTPAAPAIADFSEIGDDDTYKFCSGATLDDIETPNLQGIVYQWANDDGGGNPDLGSIISTAVNDGGRATRAELGYSANIPNSPFNPEISTYHVSSYNGFNDQTGFVGCQSAAWTAVEVTVYPQPDAPSTTGVFAGGFDTYTYCQEDDISATNLEFDVFDVSTDGNTQFKWYASNPDGLSLTPFIETTSTTTLLTEIADRSDVDINVAATTTLYATQFTDGLCESLSIQVDVLVNPIPVVDIVDEGSTTDFTDEYCYDVATAVLQGRVDGADHSGANYSWSVTPNFGLVDVGSGQANFTAADAADQGTVGSGEFNASTNYDISFTYTYPVTGCFNSITKTATVHGIPQLDILSDFVDPVGNSLTSADAVQVCESEGVINMTGEVENFKAGSGTFAITGGVNDGLIASGNSANFFPETNGDDIPSASLNHVFGIRYDYTDTDGCTNDVTETITVDVLPEVEFTVDGGCIDPDVQFEAELRFGDSPYALSNDAVPTGNNLALTWAYYYANAAGVPNLAEPYGSTTDVGIMVDETFDLGGEETGTFAAILTATSEFGCQSIVDELYTQKKVSILIDPSISFKWNGVTAGQQTEFVFRETLLNLAQISQFAITFDSGAVFTPLAPVVQSGLTVDGVEVYDPYYHTFSAPGKYDVGLTLESTNVCYDTLYHDVNIIPLVDVASLPDSRFIESFGVGDFDPDTDGWYVERLKDDALSIVEFDEVGTLTIRDHSWNWGELDLEGLGMTDGESPGDLASALTGAWSTTLSDNHYLSNEDSWLYTPAFDISGLNRPMVLFNMIYDFAVNQDGVVFQYSVDQGDTWTPLGSYSTDTDITTGLEWYNFDNVQADPGQQSSTFNALTAMGWSGEVNKPKWVSARHSLDDIPEADRGHVRFRFAIAGTEQPKDGYFGFALDDFTIQERTKNVMIEQFVSASNDDGAEEVNDPTVALKAAIDDIIPPVSVTSRDEVILAYHSDFGFDDPFNLVNPAGPSARSIYYNVDQVTSILDGQFGGSSSSAKSGDLTWTETDLSLNSLKDPGFDIIVTPDPTASSTEIKGSVEFIANQDYPIGTELRAYVVILEDTVVQTVGGISGFGHVMRKLLPSGSGQYKKLETELQKGESLLFAGENMTVSWNMANIADDANLSAIVFIQNSKTKEIYQSLKVQKNTGVVATKSGGTITDVADLIEVEDFNMYPNPTDHEVFIIFDQVIQEDMQWRIFDQTGRVFGQGEIHAGKEGFSLQTDRFPSGLYYMSIKGEKKEFDFKKLMIAH